MTEQGVADQLLRDGAGALREAALADIDQEGSSKTERVETPVLSEALVLDGDKSLLHLLRDFIDGENNAVLGGMKLDHLAVFAVQNVRCLHRFQGIRIQLRCTGKITDHDPRKNQDYNGKGDGNKESGLFDRLPAELETANSVIFFYLSCACLRNA